jgi:hypothetical protein
MTFFDLQAIANLPEVSLLNKRGARLVPAGGAALVLDHRHANQLLSEMATVMSPCRSFSGGSKEMNAEFKAPRGKAGR